jgi:peptidoglycan/xylan/chitin deacetylase (PgdA/CDA1 family)
VLIAINYHYVRPSFAAHGRGVQGVTPEQLASQVALLATAGEIVSAEQVRRAVLGDQPLPERAILVTFDDGLREQFDHALPVLSALGVPAVFFVNTLPVVSRTVCSVHKIHLLLAHLEPREFAAMLARHACARGVLFDPDAVSDACTAQYKYDTPDVARLKYLLNLMLRPDDRDQLAADCFAEAFGDEGEVSESLYMDPAQVRTLGTLGYVGTHGHEHHPIGLLSPEAMEQDIGSSVEWLAQWTGRRPFALSFPYGSAEACSRAASEAARRQGITFALTMERAGNPDLAHPLHLARFSCNDLPGHRDAKFDIGTLFERVPAATWYRD